MNADLVAPLAELARLVAAEWGPDAQVMVTDAYDSLLEHDLVDAFWLMVYPITLGAGKRLFADGTLPRSFKVTESKVTPDGVIVLNYERAGALATLG